ncbi:uncharacterized protein LOC133205985 [Saccostrea echinata]|uniref:uncharacterized protein LOC133205985 n=1 Tax=Saccostrea echinata TaxID=191078 RepID=UPI002A8415F7|nr:uncharacterized protein LOC133205985 [Saccostrea echinata]
MRINTLTCLVLVLAGCVSGLRVRYRYPSQSSGSRKTLSGWTSTNMYDRVLSNRRSRPQSLSSIWSAYRVPYQRPRFYSDLNELQGASSRRRMANSLMRDLNNLERRRTSASRLPSTRDRSSSSRVTDTSSSLRRQYGDLAQYLPLPVGEKFKSSPIKDYRANKKPLPAGPLAPEILQMRKEIKDKVESGYYGSKPIFNIP